MALDIGRVGYMAYSESTNNKTYDGREMPKWEELPQSICVAWRHAAIAILHQADVEKEQSEKGLIG